MSDSVTNMVGNADPRGAAAAGFQNAKVPLADLFAEVLDKTTFTDRMVSPSEFELTRADERDQEAPPPVDDADQDYNDPEPVDDASAEASETDENSQDGDEAEAENPSEEPAAETETPASQQAALPNDVALAIAAAQNNSKPGLTVQPNSASGVVLESKAEGATPSQARAAVTNGAAQAATHNGAAQAATHKAANTNQPHAFASDAAARGNSEFGKAQSSANAQQPDAASMKTGSGVDAAAAKSGLKTEAAMAKSRVGADTAAVEKPQAKGGPALPQTQAAKGEAADNLGASLEKHDLLATASAKRAAELHNMKVRLEAHRGAIKKAIAQSTAPSSNAAQPQGAAKSVIEITTSAAPPAAAALDGPAVRPAALFNAPTPGALPGQAGVNGSAPLATGDFVGNGAAQSASAIDRQAAASNAGRGLGFRPTASQQSFQPAEQIKVHIQQLAKSGADRIQIKLSPADLGRVEIRLEMTSDKVVQAVIYAEKPETLNMLERDARVLQQAFEEAGIKFGSNNLTFQHGQPGTSDAELADGSGQTENDAAADDDGSDGENTTDNDQPRRRQHDGVLDLEI